MNDAAKHSEEVAKAINKFQVRRDTPVTTPPPAASSATAVAPTVSPTAPLAAKASPDQATPTAATAEIISVDGVGPSAEILDLLPKEAVSKRSLARIHKLVDEWEPPKQLSKIDVRRMKHAAVLARYNDIADSAIKHMVGQILIEFKERKLPHGEFTLFVEQTMDLNMRTAQRHMLLARTFPDSATVVRLGYDWCLDVASAKPPQEILSSINAAETRIDADQIFTDWNENQRLIAAFIGITPSGKSAEDLFGRDLALELSQPNIIRELRILACEIGEPEHVREILSDYRLALANGMLGEAAVRHIRGERNQQTTSATLTAIPNPTLILQNLQGRLKALEEYEGSAIPADVSALAREIEDKLLQLAQAIQASR